MSCPRCCEPTPNMVSNHKCKPIDLTPMIEAVEKARQAMTEPTKAETKCQVCGGRLLMVEMPHHPEIAGEIVCEWATCSRPKETIKRLNKPQPSEEGPYKVGHPIKGLIHEALNDAFTQGRLAERATSKAEVEALVKAVQAAIECHEAAESGLNQRFPIEMLREALKHREGK